MALIEVDIYGKDIMGNKAMNGGHYIKGKEGMGIITVAMSSLMFQHFKQYNASFEHEQLLDNYESVLQGITTYLDKEDKESFRLAWEQGKTLQEDIQQSFNSWKNENMVNENVHYWSLFVDHIYPIL